MYNMNLSDFDFTLPEHLIALHPPEKRDGGRLLCVNSKSQQISDSFISQLAELLHTGDVLVFNITKVIPAALKGFRKRSSMNGAVEREIEINLLKNLSARHREEGINPMRQSSSCHSEAEPKNLDTSHSFRITKNGSLQNEVLRDDGICWQAFVRPLKRLKLNEYIEFADHARAQLIQIHIDGRVTLSFYNDNKPMQTHEFYAFLEAQGHMPLPPYIARKREYEAQDTERYQTIFAQIQGSVAAPTASLHFTPELLEKLTAKGIEFQYVTLHVGAGTFLPVKVENIAEHKMHSEWGEVTPQTAQAILNAKREGRRIIPVGTTSLRLLEAAALQTGEIAAFKGETDIFITPGFQFKVANAMITNFHLPKSTLFMLVSAMGGLNLMHSAYQHAIDAQYRFFSYGDACLIE